MKSIILFFDTDYTARILKKEVKDGRVEIDDGEYVVGNTTPFTVKTPTGTKPLYILKWNTIYPAEFKLEDKIVKLMGRDMKMKELVPVKPEFFVKNDLRFNPKMLKMTQELRFLKGMKSYAEGGVRDWKNILSWVLGVIMLVAGGFLIYILMKGGV